MASRNLPVLVLVVLSACFIFSLPGCNPLKGNWNDLQADSLFNEHHYAIKLKPLFTDTSKTGISYAGKIAIVNDSTIWKIVNGKQEYFPLPTYPHLLYLSTDSGNSWKYYNSFDHYESPIKLLTFDSGQGLIIICDDSIFYSLNKGGTIKRIPIGIDWRHGASYYFDHKTKNFFISTSIYYGNDQSYFFSFSEEKLTVVAPLPYADVVSYFNDTLKLINFQGKVAATNDWGLHWVYDSIALLKSTSQLMQFDRPGSFARGKYIYLRYYAASSFGQEYLFSPDFGNSWEVKIDKPILSVFEDSILVNQYSSGENGIYFGKTGEDRLSFFKDSTLYVYLSSDHNLIFGRNRFLPDYNSTQQFYHGEIMRADYSSKPEQYKLSETADSIRLEIKIKKGRAFTGNVKINLAGAPVFNYEKNKTLLSKSFFAPNADSTEWRSSFSKTIINAVRGNTYYKLELIYSDNGTVNIFNLGPFLYNPSDWFKEHPSTTIVLLIIVSYFLILLFLLLFNPLLIYDAYTRFPIFRYIESVSGKFGIALKLLSETTFFPLFVRNQRVLDAWINKYYSLIIDNFKNEPTVLKHRVLGGDHVDYISLPITTQDPNGLLIERPNVDDIKFAFKNNRTVIEIVGLGGIGKTTLALKIAEWASSGDNEKYFSHLFLPILIEEETSDLIDIIQRKLKAATGYKPEPDFLQALLSKQRLLIIVDALSERTAATQQYIRTVHGRHPINALLITSRNKLDLEVMGYTLIYPQRLSADKLLFFITSILITQDIAIFKSVENQLELGKKLAALFIFNGNEIPIVPIILKIAIEKAIELAKKDTAADITTLIAQLPNSIPEVFFTYLIMVNPEGNVPNKVSDADIQQAAELVANLSLENNFIPNDVPRKSAISELTKEHLVTPDRNALDRLISNGILVTRFYANNNFIRFSLDPLAEFLAAMHCAKQCGNDKGKWKTLYAKVKKTGSTSAGFLLALEIVHQTYAQVYGWPISNK